MPQKITIYAENAVAASLKRMATHEGRCLSNMAMKLVTEALEARKAAADVLASVKKASRSRPF